MKQFLTVFKYEYRQYVKSKSFIIITVLMVLAGFISPMIPRIKTWFSSSESGEEIVASSDYKLAVVIKTEDVNGEKLVAFLTQATNNQNITLSDKSYDDIRMDVDEENVNGALIVTSATTYKFIVKNTSMGDTTLPVYNNLLTQFYKMTAMENLGLTPEEISLIMNAAVVGEIDQTGINQENNFLFTYIILMLLYMTILMYGQFVASGVASEKSSRAMEMLITSAKPTNLIFGKVFGSGFAGLSQIVAVLAGSFISLYINKDLLINNPIISVIFDMSFELVFYTILCFILGFLLYAFMYAALASLANRTEDVSMLSMPVTLVLVIAFIVCMMNLGFGTVETTAIKVLSYVPFTSPMALFIRVTMGNMPVYGVIISLLILAGSMVLVGYLSALIYRMGVLLYGKPPKPNELFKIIKKMFKDNAATKKEKHN